MHSLLSKKLISKLAKEHGLPEYKVKDVIDSHFAFAAYILRNEVDFKKNKLPTVSIPYFGKFFFPEFNLEKLKKKYQ